jgi:hypothetical protein
MKSMCVLEMCGNKSVMEAKECFQQWYSHWQKHVTVEKRTFSKAACNEMIHDDR